MPIRGRRNPMPSKGEKPTGIFSHGNGKQKMDPVKSDHKGLLKYSLSGGGEAKGKPSGDGNPGLRHQKPAAGKSKAC